MEVNLRNRETALKTATKILEGLRGRKGFDHIIDSIQEDPSVWKEVLEEIAATILADFDAKAEP